MGFSKKVQAEALAACERRCCICHNFCGTKMALHHIVQRADGGDDSFDNCIPLCLNCHEDMGKPDPRHVTGKHYSAYELRLHRDNWYESVRNSRASIEEIPKEDIDKLFEDNCVEINGCNVNEYQNISLNFVQSGEFTFDYSNNDGKYTIGFGDFLFVTKWSKADCTKIHVYKDYLGVNGAIARVKSPKEWPMTIDCSLDFSSRTRSPNIGDVIIWRNFNGNYAATRIIDIKDDTRGANSDEVTCKYVIYSSIVS